MSFDPLSAAFDLGKSVVERIWPDANKRAEEIRKLEELRQKGSLEELNAHVQLMLGQLEVNKVEAQHKSLFVAGWRPFVGWVGGFALAWQFIIYPLLLWIWVFLQAKGYIPMVPGPNDTMVPMSAPPVLNASELFTVITGMLGIGAMRSFDKAKGTSTDMIGKIR